MAKTTRLSIVIVSWNVQEVLSECLHSLENGAEGVPSEIIVVDNASSDGTVSMIRESFPNVKLIANTVNRGFGAANNQGIETAKGRYILVLNPDTVVPEGELAKAISFLDAKSSAAVVGCHTLNGDGTLQKNCFLFPSLLNLTITTFGLHYLSGFIKAFGRERYDCWNYSKARVVPVVAGCFMLVKREAMEQVGVFDERYFMYTEETDWCYRFKKAGWKVWYTPDATIVHYGGISADKAPSQMKFELRRSFLLFLEKHHGLLYASLCRALMLIEIAIRIPFNFAIGILKLRRREAFIEVQDKLLAARLCIGLIPLHRNGR